MYAFETKTAQFNSCRTCGVVPLVTSRIEGQLYAVVNVNTFENMGAALLQHASATFVEETEEARMARRKRGWIADVQYIAART